MFTGQHVKGGRACTRRRRGRVTISRASTGHATYSRRDGGARLARELLGSSIGHHAMKMLSMRLSTPGHDPPPTGTAGGECICRVLARIGEI